MVVAVVPLAQAKELRGNRSKGEERMKLAGQNQCDERECRHPSNAWSPEAEGGSSYMLAAGHPRCPRLNPHEKGIVSRDKKEPEAP